MPRDASSAPARALFLSPEAPVAGAGGGGLRSASLLEYLRPRYTVDVADFTLRHHSKALTARIRRNAFRLIRGVPPLFDRYSGYEDQLRARMGDARYRLGIVEHFWCAGYAPLLRGRCDRLVLDLHNIESELARTHARAVGWPIGWASRRFAESYRDLERKWLPQFDALLVSSEEDKRRVDHPRVIVYPNALPELALPATPEEDCVIFSGNLEYHPNIEAVRWFRSRVWPLLQDVTEWRLVGRNPEAIARYVAGDSRIRVTGPVADAVLELARAKVCVVPLLSGSGTRFKILEAWAAGRAVVSTSIGAEGLGATNGLNLLIADDAESFAAATAKLLGDAGLRKRLGDAGRQRYLEKFTWSAAWKALAQAEI